MRAFRNMAVRTAAVSAILALPASSDGQVVRIPPPDSGVTTFVTIVPGQTYEAGALARNILGSGWRDVWRTAVKVPVFDLGSYAGGLDIEKRGGGFQTITLHLTEQNGWRQYRFRSVDKYPVLSLPNSLRGTTAGNIVQDQTGSLFPAAALIVPPFMRAVGGLHMEAKMYVMPDDPRLGKHRAAFAGMLGTVELKGEEAPGDKPGFAGATKIKGTDAFFEDLSESRAHRLDEREFLAVRLIDFLINDGDRTPDNYDWARFGEEGNYRWRPLSRDRDRAFTDASGLLNRLIVRKFYPKFTEFTTEYSMRGLMTSSYIFDRRLLQRLTAQDFEQIARQVQQAVSDSVIEASIMALPPEWRAETEAPERLRTTLRVRRDKLPAVAMKFYAKLASEVDIHLTNDSERADIERHPDGRVTVTVPGPADSAKKDIRPFFQRTFLPSETNEVRVYLGKGDDTVVIRGASNDDIAVRLIGDAGADILADSAGGGATFFYDAEGDNTFITKRSTRVSILPWIAPKPIFGFSPGSAWVPDWGKSTGFTPAFRHVEGGGLAVGFGPRFKSYGFRRMPHWWEAKAAFLVGTGNGRMALTANADYRAENSALALTLAARASELEAFRFYGYGNDTPNIGRELSLVEQRVLAVEPALVWNIGWRAREGRGDLLRHQEAELPGLRPIVGRLQVGPVISWTDPEMQAGTPLAAPSVLGGQTFALAGLKVGVDLDATDSSPIPKRGWNVRANMAAYPSGLDLPETFSTASASGAAYLPLGGRGPHLAFRVGGGVASGDFPAQYAPAIGGSSTLRGYRSRRFAGDAFANGASELRIPVGTVNFFVRSDVGIFGLADVGRVWFNGSSDGAWHTGLGGGVWLAAFGRVMNFSYAYGEQHRFYMKSGLAF